MKATVCLGIAFALSTAPVWACSQLEPAAAFIFINDTNRDQLLDMYEWRNAKTPNLEVAFNVGDMNEFLRLDYNRDRYLQAAEIGFDNVRYIRPPCADMEERRFIHGFRQRAN